MRTFLLVACLLAAGCLGGEPSAPAASPATTQPSSPAAAAEAPPAPEPVVVLLKETWMLRTGAAVCPPETRSHCIVPVAGGAAGRQDWVDGLLSSFVANVSWAATSPLTQSLLFYFGGCFGTEEAYECETLASVEGASPLAIDLPQMTRSWNYYYAIVQMPAQATEPHAAWSVEQAVAIDGALAWAREPATA